MSLRYTLMTCLLCAVTAPAWAQGGLFVTGHDPDFHAFRGGNAAGAKNIIIKGLDYITDGVANNSNPIGTVLLVTSRINPGAGYSDPVNGLAAAGLTFDVADDGTAGGAVLDLHSVDFASYDAVIVASDFGGWLRQGELDILNARSVDILNYINAGGAVMAFAESGNAGSGLTTHSQFAWAPFLVTQMTLNQSESGFTVTPFGASLGLTNADVNGNASHNIFTATGGMNVVDLDAHGNIMSLAFFGRIGPSGVVPEPGPLSLLGASIVTLGGAFLRRRKAGSQ
jgi:hypothetical protein